MLIRLLLLIPLVLLLMAPNSCALRPDGYFPVGEWNERQMEWLRFATEVPLNPASIPNVMAHLEREKRDAAFSVPEGSVPVDAWDGAFDKMWRLRDTSDFDALRLVSALYSFADHKVANELLWHKVADALSTFKYWYTDPTPARVVDGEQVVDSMWYWTENHILIFHTVELLAGKWMPDRVFSVTGMTGQQHADRARPRILRWLDERAKFGFTEWHSDVYYNLDMRPLLALIDYSDDPEIERRATMVLDLVFLDIALGVHRGNFGTTHGRSYVKDKVAAELQDIFDQTKMYFDDTELPYRSRGSSSGVAFASTRKYRLPEVIRRIARSDEPSWNLARMNLPLDEVPPTDPASTPPPVAPHGLDYRDEANLPFWWSMGSQAVWMMLPLTLEVGERENLWDSQFAPFKALRDLVWTPGDLPATIIKAQNLAGFLWKVINESLLAEVNTATWRTQHYMLSTAQDYRKGLRGSQTHSWQATLSEHALVFTQHPSYLPVAPGGSVPPDWNWQQKDEPGPGYWTGESAQPRSVQHHNVGISIYSPQYGRIPSFGFDFRDETHAYFPHAHMDEVVQQGSWTFGRKDDAYVALYSWRPTMWRGGQPEVFQNAGLDFDLVAPGGANNVWIVECGSIDEWPGGFAAFQAAILAAAVSVTPTATAFDVSYDSPSQGTFTVGWDGPLQVDGNDVAIHGYPRFDNPYVHTEFGETVYDIREGEYSLLLEFDRGERTATAPRPIWNLP